MHFAAFTLMMVSVARSTSSLGRRTTRNGLLGNEDETFPKEKMVDDMTDYVTQIQPMTMPEHKGKLQPTDLTAFGQLIMKMRWLVAITTCFSRVHTCTRFAL